MSDRGTGDWMNATGFPASITVFYAITAKVVCMHRNFCELLVQTKVTRTNLSTFQVASVYILRWNPLDLTLGTLRGGSYWHACLSFAKWYLLNFQWCPQIGYCQCIRSASHLKPACSDPEQSNVRWTFLFGLRTWPLQTVPRLAQSVAARQPSC